MCSAAALLAYWVDPAIPKERSKFATQMVKLGSGGKAGTTSKDVRSLDICLTRIEPNQAVLGSVMSMFTSLSLDLEVEIGSLAFHAAGK